MGREGTKIQDTDPEANIHFTHVCFGKDTNVSKTSAELILNKEAGLSPLCLARSFTIPWRLGLLLQFLQLRIFDDFLTLGYKPFHQIFLSILLSLDLTACGLAVRYYQHPHRDTHGQLLHARAQQRSKHAAGIHTTKAVANLQLLAQRYPLVCILTCVCD